MRKKEGVFGLGVDALPLQVVEVDSGAGAGGAVPLATGGEFVLELEQGEKGTLFLPWLW